MDEPKAKRGTGRPMMGASANRSGQPTLSPPASRTRPSVWFVLVPLLVVLITFLFWYDTWLGRPLSDRQMTAYLSSHADPRQTQHALAVLAERIESGDPKARRWYPEVVALASSKIAELRIMAAWVMGEDNSSAAFHTALKTMLADPDPMAEWNAALALSRYGDASGDAQLREMLEPYALKATATGVVHWLVHPGNVVHRDTSVVRIAAAGQDNLVIPSPLAGRVQALDVPEGGHVRSGETVATIFPGNRQALEALQALYLVGESPDLADVERFSQGVSGYSPNVREQARLTTQAIEARAKRAITSEASSQSLK